MRHPPCVGRWSLLMAVLGVLAMTVPVGATVTRPLPPDSTIAVPPVPPPGSGVSYMIGALLLERGEAAAALPYLSFAHVHDPGTPLITRTYLEALVRTGDLAGALDLARDLAAEPDASFADVQQLLRLQLATARLDEAETTVERVARQWPDSAQVELWRGEVLARRGRPDAACAAYARFAERRPDRQDLAVEAMSRLAAALTGEAAMRCWRRALALAPDDPGLLVRYLEDLAGRHRTATAVAVATRADSVGTPRAPDGSWQFLAGMFLAGEQQADSLLAHYLPRLRTGRLPADAAALVVRVLAEQERWEDALAASGEALARWPRDLDLLDLRARLLVSRDRLNEAIATARRAADLAPDSLSVQLLLLRLLNERHQDAFRNIDAPPDSAARSEILPVARRAAALLDDGTDPVTAMLVAADLQAMGDQAASIPVYRLAARDTAQARDAVLNIAVALEKTDRLDAALALLDSLQAARPDDPVVANALGYMLADHDRDLDRAERLIRRALAARPDDPAYLDSLGWVMYRRGDLDAAFDLLVQAVNRSPDDPVILEHLARTLHGQGQVEQAVELLDRALAAGGDPDRLRSLRHRWAGAGAPR